MMVSLAHLVETILSMIVFLQHSSHAMARWKLGSMLILRLIVREVVEKKCSP